MSPRALGCGLAVLCATALWCTAAGADTSAGIYEGDWREDQREPEDFESEWFVPEHFAFEVRFGPYWPEIDEEFSQSPGPYERVFGTHGRLYFGLELDWQPLRIPYIGTFGPAFGWGWTRSGGEGFVVSSGERAGETSIVILPMHFSGVLRGDYLLRKWGVPVVPYAKLGLGLGMWTASGGDDTSEVGGVTGKGTSYGMHLALGGAIAVTAFDRAAESGMRADSGIQNAFLFGEWMYANLDGIGSYPQMHVGSSTFAVGVGIDW